MTDMLDAKRVIAVVGPIWWPAVGPADLAGLPERPRPLYRGGRAHDRAWVVGWHLNGACYRGFDAEPYVKVIFDAVAEVERPSAARCSAGSGGRESWCELDGVCIVDRW